MIFKLFILKEIKKYPLFFLLVIFTLSLGCLGITAIAVFSDQVKSKLTTHAKELLTSDLAISARRELTDQELLAIQEIMNPYQHSFYKVFDIYSMGLDLKTSQTKLLEVRGVEPTFPFYGSITTEQGKMSQTGITISQDLAQLWSVTKGDQLKIGDLTLIITGVIKTDSSVGLRGFSLAPRAYVPLDVLIKTGLLKPGSTGSFAYHYFFHNLNPDEINKIRQNILNRIPDRAVIVNLPIDTSEQNARVLNYLTDFMSLASLVGLILSLVGIFYLYQSQLMARLKDYCLFNLMGMTKNNILVGLLAQFSVVYLVTMVLLVVIITTLYPVSVPLLKELLQIDLTKEIQWKLVLVQFPILYLVAISALVPLFLGLFRTEMGQQIKSSKLSLGSYHFIDFLPFASLLWIVSCYLAHSIKVGSIFFFALIVIFLLCSFLIWFFRYLLKKFILSASLLNPRLEMGIAFRNILRTGHRITFSFLSISIGVTLISFIMQLDYLIQGEFTLSENKPSLFLFDIQEDQLDALVDFTKSQGLQLDGVTPLVRARLEKLNGKPFSRSQESGLQTREEEVEGRFKNRGVNLTYRQDLSLSEKIVEGEEFSHSPSESSPLAPLSLEKRYAQRLGIKLGDKLTFDVQGIEVEGFVQNFRDVKWTSFYPNFFVNFKPGFIDLAPKNFLAVLPQVKSDIKANYQREVVKRFSNISFIDVAEIIQRLAVLFEKSRMAIEVISWLSLLIGFIVLYGLSHDQVYRRSYDLALLKTLGFSVKSVTYELLFEFGLIFFMALSVGIFLGWGMAVVAAREIFKIPWGLDAHGLSLLAILLSLACLATIILASRQALKAAPRKLLSEN